MTHWKLFRTWLLWYFWTIRLLLARWLDTVSVLVLFHNVLTRWRLTVTNMSRAGLARLGTGGLPGGPMSVRADMTAAITVIFKFTINCHVSNTSTRNMKILSILRIYLFLYILFKSIYVPVAVLNTF